MSAAEDVSYEEPPKRLRIRRLGQRQTFPRKTLDFVERRGPVEKGSSEEEIALGPFGREPDHLAHLLNGSVPVVNLAQNFAEVEACLEAVRIIGDFGGVRRSRFFWPALFLIEHTQVELRAREPGMLDEDVVEHRLCPIELLQV